MSFYTNKLKEITIQPKIYFYDLGLRNAILLDYPINLDTQGFLFENYIFSELKKQGYTPKYWRSKTKQEVDFIIENGKTIIPIEVKLSCNSQIIESSLKSFIDIYKPKKAYVVYYKGKTNKIKQNGCEVFFLNTFELLEELKSIWN